MVIKLFLAFLTGISASLFFDSAFSQEEVAGRAKVISGDTLSIKNIEDGKQFTFRLWGIDAPELDQPCEKKNGQSVGESIYSNLPALHRFSPHDL